ncbi:MAG: hypothetical protein Q9170_007355 [Blastenia crenularia]
MDGNPMVASPVEGVPSNTAPIRSRRSTPRPQPPEPPKALDPKSSTDFRSLMQTFSEGVISTAVQQCRYELLDHDEQLQCDEQSRWSRYSNEFVTIGEDQSRKIKATKKLKGELQDRLNQAKQTNEKAAENIAQSLSAAEDARKHVIHTEDDVISKRWENKFRGQREEIDSLKREISSLRHSVVDVKSGYHRLQELDEAQRFWEQELSRLKRETVKEITYRKSEKFMDEKISDITARCKIFTKFASKQEQVNKDLSNFETRKIDSMKSELDSKLNSLEENLCKSATTNGTNSTRLQKLENDVASSSKAIVSITEFRDQMETSLDDLRRNLQQNASALSKAETEARKIDSIKSGMESKLQSLGEDLRKTARTSDETTSSRIRKLEEDMACSKQAIISLDEFKGQAMNSFKELRSGLENAINASSTVESLQELKLQFQSFEGAVQSLGKQQSSQKNALEELDGRFKSEVAVTNQRLTDNAERSQNIIETSQNFLETWAQDMKGLRDDNQALRLRFDQSALNKDIHAHSQALKTKSGDQSSIAQSLALVRLEQNMDERFGEIYQRLDARKEFEDQRDEFVAREIEAINDVVIKETERLTSTYETLNDVVIKETERLTSTYETQAAILATNQSQLERQQSQLEELEKKQPSPNSRVISSVQQAIQPSPPRSISGMKDEVQPKIEALESTVQDLKSSKDGFTDKLKAIESFQATQESRWNNLTTEPMVRSVIYHIQQVHPLPYLQAGLDQVGKRLFQQELQTNQLQEFRTRHAVEMEKFKEIDKVTHEITNLSNDNKKSLEDMELRVDSLQLSLGDVRKELTGIKAINDVRDKKGAPELLLVQDVIMRVGSLEENFNTFYDENKELCARLELDVKELQSQVPKIQHHSSDQDDGSDSDVPIQQKKKRSQPSQESDGVMAKKRKLAAVTQDDDNDYAGEKPTSTPPPWTKKSARNLSQQLDNSPVSPARQRGRPRKNTD